MDAGHVSEEKQPARHNDQCADENQNECDHRWCWRCAQALAKHRERTEHAEASMRACGLRVAQAEEMAAAHACASERTAGELRREAQRIRCEALHARTEFVRVKQSVLHELGTFGTELQRMRQMPLCSVAAAPASAAADVVARQRRAEVEAEAASASLRGIELRVSLSDVHADMSVGSGRMVDELSEQAPDAHTHA
jgi:hypothetical protein